MKPLWGCYACKRNLPHEHEETATHQEPLQEKPFTKVRAQALVKDIERLFFQGYRGRWLLYKKVNDAPPS